MQTSLCLLKNSHCLTHLWSEDSGKLAFLLSYSNGPAGTSVERQDQRFVPEEAASMTALPSAESLATSGTEARCVAMPAEQLEQPLPPMNLSVPQATRAPLCLACTTSLTATLSPSEQSAYSTAPHPCPVEPQPCPTCSVPSPSA
ncbi:PREDICTED: translation initiation factor IF-2-like [Rhinopithecus bieti]|uniref:translation initiation factor IF-2-like n=1 Tax=Rhinopithecus bieti TaxID=61621 RepID=UPI00083C7161|nr:PREDICTED: translation initiation factor IF-2-like [Rhinopithecus bieti]